MGCWVIFMAAFVWRVRPGKAGEAKRAREMKRDGSAVLGMSLQFLCYLVTWLPPFQRRQFSPIVPMPPIAEWAVAAVTVVMAAMSVWLVDAASRRLGKQWALAARVVEGHDLIKDGPYKWVRNPIYLGMLGLLVATGLALSWWKILIPVVLVFAAGTVIRIRSEERLLRQAFGATFEEYTRKVPALIPGIF
jgi:protein-S-isoprenylcysteine O-methyltransferase Ste14